MRQLQEVPAGLWFNSVISHRGRFYSLCAGLKGGGRLVIGVRDLTGERAWEYQQEGGATYWVGFHLVPDVGLCVAVNDRTAVCLETGAEVSLAATPYDRTADYRFRVAWTAVRNKFQVGRGSDRAASTDTHVFMTGSAARTFGQIAMGPTQHQKVKAAKGFNRGYVVSYRRGGEARVMRLPNGGENNPVHMVASEDGLTFLAVCRRAIFQIDADVD